ncbi:MAG: ArsS family sensor histidine kinase [Halarcobacter sp.]
MNRESIFFTITVSFIISMLLVLISFAILLKTNQEGLEHDLLRKYGPVSKIVFKQYHKHNEFSTRFIDNLETLNYILIDKKTAVDAITYNINTKVIVDRDIRDIKFRVLQLNDKQYVYLKRKNMTFLIEDKNGLTQNDSIYIILVFIVILITLILSFIVTLRKLMPLKILKDKVSNLGDENFDFECCDTNRKDEVSRLGMEFKKTAKKLKQIKEARNIFIRNIMHELKTPITKGKFLAELDRSEDNDKRLKEVFNRLEQLINEFASIEELISSTKNIEKNYYFLNDIIDNAKDILMVEDDEVEEHHENKKLEVNFKLFCVAVKNLIDNAIKYSSNKKVIIKSENEDIIFENIGEPLKYKLEEYYEPFFSNEEKRENSFGLGFYIINNILKANDYTLEYMYKDRTNIFICKRIKK